MDRQRVKDLSDKLRETLNAFAEENDLDSATFGSVTFDRTSFKTTVHVNEKLDEETKIQRFDLTAHRLDLPKGLYNKEITFQDETFVIKDLNIRAKKYPIIAQGEDGKNYKLPPSAVE